ncbi:41 kDa spicule matrix protein [Elysia marginata]|uniref:41 kDa spicule matrix protein n=1 Tax=Elysia marginata TaxID=1093978 RepID=A0AAV4FAJ0_9GAST|nr:41 kDa spicule matrix protein [Elysia marginata]
MIFIGIGLIIISPLLILYWVLRSCYECCKKSGKEQDVEAGKVDECQAFSPHRGPDDQTYKQNVSRHEFINECYSGPAQSTSNIVTSLGIDRSRPETRGRPETRASVQSRAIVQPRASVHTKASFHTLASVQPRIGVQPVASVQPRAGVHTIAIVQPVASVQPRVSFQPVVSVLPRAGVHTRASLQPVVSVQRRAGVQPRPSLQPVASVHSRASVQTRASESITQTPHARSKSIEGSGRSRLESKVDRSRERSCTGRRSKSLHERGRAFHGQRTVAEISSDGKTIDLHQMSRQHAISETQRFLKQKETEYSEGGYRKKDRYTHIVTGQGKHSKDGKPVLKPEVEHFLKKEGFAYSIPANNPGKVTIDLWKSQNRFFCPSTRSNYA